MDRENLPQEVIVVEGKSDTQRLKYVFGPNVKTIETQGSAIDESLRPYLENAQKQFGLIVFTDPDFQGERIRRIIRNWVPEAKHAYLSPNQAKGIKQNDTLGIEHASAHSIEQAIFSVSTPNIQSDTKEISVTALMKLGLIGQKGSRDLRIRVGEHFNIGPTNGRQLQHRLKIYNITLEQLEEFIEKEGKDA